MKTPKAMTRNRYWTLRKAERTHYLARLDGALREAVLDATEQHTEEYWRAIEKSALTDEERQ